MAREFRKYSFGTFQFAADEHALRRADGHVTGMTPKVAQLLITLLESGGRLLTKQELVRTLWPETFVDEANLPFQVHQLRQLLGDRADDPQYIQTVAKRGYRFIVPVAVVDDVYPAARPTQQPAETPAAVRVAPAATAPSATRSAIVKRKWLAVASLGFVLATVVLVVRSGEPSVPTVSRIVRLTHDGLRKEWLLPVSDARMIVWTGHGHHVVRLDEDRTEPIEALNEFIALDVAPSRMEALAIRRGDRGGELGLWVVPLAAGGAARRLGMARARSVAAWSHDGRQLAYAFDNALFVADANGAFVRQLMTFSDNIADIQWSRDDRRIRFTRYASSDRVVSMTPAEINVDGTGLRNFLSPDDVQDPHGGRWFSDGQDFVFLAGAECCWQVYLLHEKTTWFGGHDRPRPVRVSTPPLNWASAIPSADGKRIYALGMSPPQLVAYNGQRQTFEPYLGGIAAFGVDFSHDKRSVAYVDFPRRQLWRARADGQERHPLTPESWETGGPAWSPDDQRIAFRAKAPGTHTKIYLVRADGGTPTPLEQRDVEQGTPTWSPDGKRLAFGDVPETFGQPTGSEAIHIYDLARRQVSDVPGSRGLWSSRWSPDGRYLAALTIREQSLMLFDFEAGSWRSLGIDHVSDPVWSRDSKYLYCFPEAEERRIARVRIPEGIVDSVIDLRRLKIQVYSAGLALDGSPLVLRTPIDIYAMELDR